MALDLIDKILVADPYMRLSIKEAKNHPYFEQINSTNFSKE